MRSLLVRLIGFPATLIHSDTMVSDRWRWLKRRLPRVYNDERLLEVGCGAGAFTIGAAQRGYRATGLSWDVVNQRLAAERAAICNAPNATFIIADARVLGEQHNFRGAFDVVICLECIEHILDDEKLMRDLTACLKPGGRLLLTTPNIHYRPLNPEDNGPWLPIEDGGHVRKGYNEQRLRELSEKAGLAVRDVTFCSGVVSQKLSAFWRLGFRSVRIMTWLLLLPLRVLPLLFDDLVTGALNWPYYSICLEASKPGRGHENYRPERLGAVVEYTT